MKKKILFNGLGNRGWIGGLYYIKNIMFSCLQNKRIMQRYQLVVLIDPEHADIFDCFRGEKNVDIRIFAGENKIKLALYEMGLIWLGGVKYCYALELNKIGKLFRRKGVFWIPDFQHRTLPKFFSKEELKRKRHNDLAMTGSENVMVVSSRDAAHDLERFYPEHRCKVHVVHFVSYIEPEVRAVTPSLMRQVREKFDLKRNYIYIPNQFWQHKNHIVMLQAIELLLRQGRLKEYDFVFTGSLDDYRNPKYIKKLKEIMESPAVCDNIKLLGFVERTEQLAIMKQAQFIVQPSLCEGWGTVLEDAKVLDKVVLLSDIPVHREQKNDKCVLFAPHNAAELAETIERMAHKAGQPEHAAEFAGDTERGIANMYREAKQYSKALERVFR